MNLLFIEPDKEFFEWIARALAAHQCTIAPTVEAAAGCLTGSHYDACFVDLSGFGDEAAAVIARARVSSTAAKCPLIMLTGKEARADLIKVCDGFLFKPALTHPQTEIPQAVDLVAKRTDAAHPMDLTAKIFQAVTALKMVV